MNKNNRKQYNDLLAALRAEYQKWQTIHDLGWQDPFTPDGANMKLVRDHIISFRKNIQELCEEQDLPKPEELALPLPPVVPNNYMAGSENIRTDARNALKIYEEDIEYQYILQIRDLPDVQNGRAQKEIKATIRLVSSLRDAIEADDLLTMRQYGRNVDIYTDAIHRAAEKCKSLLEKKSM